MRLVPLGAMIVIAFVLGLLLQGNPAAAERATVAQYIRDWSAGRYRAMYALLDGYSRHKTSEVDFQATYVAADDVSTLRGVQLIRVLTRKGDLIPARVVAITKLFGSLEAVLDVPVQGSGSDARIRFSDRLLFPGLGPGEHLTRRVTLPPRGEILARDGTPLAEGPGRTSPDPGIAGEIVGNLGPIPSAEVAQYAAAGYPPTAQVGQDGLERIFETRLAGSPGGSLLAGRRLLATIAPERGLPVTTTIDPAIEQAAIAAMGGKYAGIVAMDPRNGQLLALAGIAFSALQPPGSTFKIITATGALEAGIVHLGTAFPVASQAVLDGVTLQNANGEVCGGTLIEAFAVSCNSVFAPLGARLGAAKLVAIAERFGFNQPVAGIPGAAESLIPSAASIGDSLAVGSSAIGQGLVQTTPLEMTDVAATIADGGQRPIPTLAIDAAPSFAKVTSVHVAHLVQEMMEAVVRYGTGTAAQIPGVVVAGKTGTAELRTTVVTPGTTPDPNAPPLNSPLNTDAWFVGYAPVGHPRIVVGALFPASGAGGSTAAPAVHDVLVAALQQHY
jgi:cell division protein FtsI/penicillin-binding protein 2